MANIWQKIKNFIKRFYPLTFRHFDQETGRVNQKLRRIEIRTNKTWNAIIRSTPRTELLLEFGVTEHCNLNCAGCDHFSPLAEPEFVDYEETARDFARLSSLFHGHAREIRVMGGEPLLHPDLIKLLKMIRENFPDAYISLITNGLLLPNQPEEFWLACKENRIVVRPTKYPISLNYDEIESRAMDYGVEYRYYNNSQVVKTLWHHKLDIRGLQENSRQFLQCFRANNCTYMRHGRLFTCTVAPTARHFSKYFEVDLKEFPEDSIDIYQANSAQEILAFLARPIPFCRYCMAEKIKYSIPWHQSERSIQEWT